MFYSLATESSFAIGAPCSVPEIARARKGKKGGNDRAQILKKLARRYGTRDARVSCFERGTPRSRRSARLRCRGGESCELVRTSNRVRASVDLRLLPFRDRC
jgi:hypothetical protein